MCLWRGFLLAAWILALISSDLLAQVGNFDQSALRRRLVAEAFAPVFYQHESLDLLDPNTGFNPIDSILGFNFDGNADLRDNARNVFLLSDESARQAVSHPEIYYSVIESRSHFYINYIVYHAIDTNGLGHAHDTENAFVIVRKTSEFPGALEVLITNAHGFPNIYSPDAERMAAWRSRIKSQLAHSVLLSVDSFARAHHEDGPMEFIERGRSISPLIFVHSKSHALYKFSSQAWSSSNQVGSFYFPQSCLECVLAPVPFSGVRKTIAYQLRDFDDMMLNLKPGMDWSLVFQDSFEKRRLRKLDHYRERELPGYLAVGVLEARPAAILFFRGSFKTAYPLSDPIAFHRYFDPKNDQISRQYLLNAYLDSDSP